LRRQVYSPSTGIAGVSGKLPDDTRILEELAMADDGRDKSTTKTPVVTAEDGTS
jgi:hypothetical protein